ncbi:uncharacterized protein LOC141614273 [Silene latifolia]|uniref:uncharacterized protein LOC141614273 n=1 Tax=Silene latifolia TaxID=37657 RepID=UPI003D777BD0
MVRNANGEIDADRIRRLEAALATMVKGFTNHLNNNNNHPQKTVLDRFARHRPPTYDGTNGPTALESWIREIEKLFLATGCPEDQKVDIATYYLKDEVDNWWALDRVGLEVLPGYCWTVFIKALKKWFYHEEMRWQKEQEFLRLQQGSMTLKDYTNKFVKLSRLVTFVAMDEVSRTCHYEKNLAPKVRTAMSGIHSTSFQQAYDPSVSIYDLVLATEAEESAMSKYCTTGDPITCFTCKAPGHKAIDCPQKPKIDAPKADSPKTGRVFIMSRAEADENPDVVTVTSLSSFGTSISLYTGEIVSCSVLFKDLPVSIVGAILPADLVQFKLGEFDVTLGMDWLSRYDARVLGYTSTVKWVSALKMINMGKKSHQIYLCVVRDVSAESKLEDIPLVKKLPNVFPKYLPGIPPE